MLLRGGRLAIPLLHNALPIVGTQVILFAQSKQLSLDLNILYEISI